MVRRIASDLLTIEVNTIIKPCMTARKMPPPPVALLDIVTLYSGYLAQVSTELTVEGVSENVQPVPPEKNGKGAFFNTYNDAEQLEKLIAERGIGGDDQEEGDWATTRVILRRISHYSHLIYNILDDLERTCKSKSGLNWWNASKEELYRQYNELIDISIDPHYVALIRKSWDMGVEQVVMQTVVQIDGDMISRIQKGFENEEHRGLQQLHLETCRMGVETWETMTRLVIHFIRGVGQVFMGLIVPRGS